MSRLKTTCKGGVDDATNAKPKSRSARKRMRCGCIRCESGLPAKFTDRECEAYIWMWEKPPWAVDLLDESVRTGSGKRYKNLIEFAKAHGWEG